MFSVATHTSVISVCLFWQALRKVAILHPLVNKMAAMAGGWRSRLCVYLKGKRNTETEPQGLYKRLLSLLLIKYRYIKVYEGGGGTAPCILNLGTRWRWVHNFMLQPLYHAWTWGWSSLLRLEPNLSLAIIFVVQILWILIGASGMFGG
jgi:hypothetical protein